MRQEQPGLYESPFRKEGRKAVHNMWVVIMIFTFIDFIVSCAVVDKNHHTFGGNAGASFAAIWSCFLAISFAAVSSMVIRNGQASAIVVGFLLGSSAMLSQLFFVLMCFFLTIGTSAAHNNYASADADKAMGAFSFINMVIYAVFAIILGVHRNTLTTVGAVTVAGAENGYNNYPSTKNYDPTIDEDCHVNDQEQL